MKKASCIVGAAVVSLIIIFAANVIINKQNITTIATQDTTSSIERTSENTEVAVASVEPDEEYLEAVEYIDATADVVSFEDNIQAVSAILIDADSKSVLYEKNADEQLAPASTTKLMTALTAYEYLKLSDKITVGEEIEMIGKDSSTAGLKKGQVMTFEELLEGMLISSGNDAAYTIAAAAGKVIIDEDIANDGKEFDIQDYVAKFVSYMNKNVRKLGLKNTSFRSPDGYDAKGQYTTAYDLSKIAMAVIDNRDISRICDMTEVKLKDLGLNFTTTNELLLEDSKYYYEYAKGLKTGSTDSAGKCLVSYANKDGEECISVVLGSTTEGRWEDSKLLLELGLQQ